MKLDKNMTIAGYEIKNVVLFNGDTLYHRIDSVEFALNIMNRTLNIDEPEIVNIGMTEHVIPYLQHTHMIVSKNLATLCLFIPMENISIYQADKITYEDTFETHMCDIFEILVDGYPFEIEANEKIIYSNEGKEIKTLYDELKWNIDISLDDTETLYKFYDIKRKENETR